VAFLLSNGKELLMETAIDFGQPLSVLIVEDNNIDRRILESMLKERSDYTGLLKATDTLEKTLHLMDEYEFDVVILDLNLPDSHGEETLLKLTKKNPKVAVVVNTGAYEDRLGLRTLSIGAQDFLVKGKYTAYLLNKVIHYAVERKRFEMELKQAYDKLKETQTQLIHAEKMKVIGALASGVAHEVKNPLATILYGVTYLNETLANGDEKVKTVLYNIKDASNRADRIVTDLLDFARLRQLNKEKQSINHVIEKTLSLIKHELDQKHILVKKNLGADLPMLEIDLHKIEQVLVNIMLNSIHAMKHSGELMLTSEVITLSESIEEIPTLHRLHFTPGQRVVSVSVEDAGSGIPPLALEKIFEPFYTTRRADGGIGLGLCVSRNIMDIHQGSISISNREVRGAIAKLHFKI